ncbi:UNVERIFIED_CONTAM: hypothetical protein NCL1_24246 [Trichonephila clavipes]
MRELYVEFSPFGEPPPLQGFPINNSNPILPRSTAPDGFDFSPYELVKYLQRFWSVWFGSTWTRPPTDEYYTFSNIHCHVFTWGPPAWNNDNLVYPVDLRDSREAFEEFYLKVIHVLPNEHEYS